MLPEAEVITASAELTMENGFGVKNSVLLVLWGFPGSCYPPAG